MSKMRAPEMDVIRFNESDVIVASVSVPAGVLRVSGMADLDEIGAFAVGNQIYYTNNIPEDFYSILNSALDPDRNRINPNTVLYHSTDDGPRGMYIRNLIKYDSSTSLPGYDGDYEWPGKGKFDYFWMEQ